MRETKRSSRPAFRVTACHIGDAPWPSWDAADFDDVVVAAFDDTAVVSYRFTGRRDGEPAYRAQLSSTYIYRGGAWRVALHQQTPLPG